MSMVILTPENEHLVGIMGKMTGMSFQDIINKCIWDSIRLYYPIVWTNEENIFGLYVDKGTIKSCNIKPERKSKIVKPSPKKD